MPEKRPDSEMVHGVPEVAVSSTTTMANRTGSWKYTRPVFQDMVAPCNATCAIGVDIEGTMNLVREGRLVEARELLLRENPMPATTGRICDHPCESSCNRKSFDQPVAVHSVERMLGDLALEDPLPAAVVRIRTGKAAVIGSGPAGLACAYHLVRMGYEVSVFEGDEEPGGTLRYRVPEFQLPRVVLDREIERMRALGVDIRCGVRLGRQLTWKYLERFDTVFLATGAHRSRALGVEGENLPGIQYGLDFLHEVGAGRAPEIGARVVVVGGDSVALDCARTALRLGAEVQLVFWGECEKLAADPAEVLEAEREGVEILYQTVPLAIRGSEQMAEEGAREPANTISAGISGAPTGMPMGLECIRMTLEKPDGYGGDPIPAEDGRQVLSAQTVIIAMGEEPDFDLLPLDLKHDQVRVAVDELGRTSKSAVFAGGGIVEEPHTIAHALGSGKRAAIGMDLYMRERAGEKVEAPSLAGLRYGRVGNFSITRYRGDDPVRRTGEVNEVAGVERINMAHFAPMPRRVERRMKPSDREGFEEVNLGLTQKEAVAEATRCFNCGTCNQCEMCLIFCPDVAITRREGDKKFSISYKYCKGCGVCAVECPRGAISMTREGL